jgi:dihydrofolate synthase/folylpolyglutamate synthase
MFNNIDDALNWLYNQKKLAKRENLDRIKRCVSELNIKLDYKIIHMAGTNGKGSCCNYIKNILKHTGKHIGMFTSPYYLFFNERIMINDRYISNAEILNYVNYLYDYSRSYYDKYNDVIPFFELTLLMALLYFQDRKIDLAIIECGLGGRLDSTNFVNSNLSIITNIGYDHMMQLGNTLEEIASHKLGIVKENGYLLTAVDELLMPEFGDYCNQMNAKIVNINSYVSDIKVSDKTEFNYKNNNYVVNLLGSYQAYNAALAIEAAKYIEPNIEEDLIEFGLEETNIPGRFEYILDNVIIDGAHNISAINNLVDNIKNMYHKKVKIVFSALADKAYDKMLNKLDEIALKYYFTTINDKRASDVNVFKESTNIDSICYNNMDECIDVALKELKEDELLLITGSIHFISLVRNLIKK